MATNNETEELIEFANLTTMEKEENVFGKFLWEISTYS